MIAKRIAKNSVHGLCLLGLSLLLTSCLGSGGGNTGGSGPGTTPGKVCDNEVLKTYVPLQIQGGKHIYFDPKALAFLDDPTFVLQSIVLVAELSGKHKTNSDFSVGLNGLELVKNDGSRALDAADAKGSNTEVRVRLHNMKLNGMLSLLTYLLKIKSQKGELRISLQGRDGKVISARLEIRGYSTKDCAQPTPQPTPPPVAPIVSIKSYEPLDDVTAETAARFEFESNQSGVTFLCSLDDAAAQACNSPMIYSGLANGDHKFSVLARNANGLVSTQAATRSWKVDTVAPAVTIAPPPSLTNSNSVSVEFSSDEAGVSFKCALDMGTIQSCSSPATFAGLTEGQHSLSIVAVDSLGNVSEPSSVYWMIDLTAPSVNFLEVVPAAMKSSSVERKFSFSSDESASFECALDEQPFASCESPVTLSSITEGGHRFAVRAKDAAANIGAPAYSVWITDLTAPVLTLGNTLPKPGAINSRDFSVEFTSSEPGEFLCSVNGSSEATCSSPLTGSFVNEGAQVVEIIAIDEAGLRSAPSRIEWILDTTAPSLSFGAITPSNAAQINSNELSVDVIAPEDASLEATLNGSLLNSSSSPIVLSALAEGDYNLTVVGVDGSGNRSEPISHVFRVDLTAPTLSLSSDLDAALTRSTRVAFTFVADENATYECELDGAGFSACESPHEIAGLIDGDHLFKVRAKDPAGNSSAIAQAAWVVDTTAPVTTIQPRAQTSRDSVTADLSSSEEASSFKCTIDGGAEVSCSSPATFTGLTEGTHTISAYAIDAVGNRDMNGASFTLTVLPAVTTQFTVTPTIVYTNQTTASFSFKSNHPDALFRCTLDGNPIQPCAGSVNLSGVSEGNHTFKVQAVDKFGGVDPVGVSHSWTVDATSPVVLSTSSSATSTTITVTWTTNELATSKLNYGVGTDLSQSVAETSTYQTSHSLRINGLTPNTTYSVQIGGRDKAGNAYTGSRLSIRTRL